MNNHAYEDQHVADQLALVEGIHSNAVKLYGFALSISRSSNVADDARNAAWALVAACNTYQPQSQVAAGESLPY